MNKQAEQLSALLVALDHYVGEELKYLPAENQIEEILHGFRMLHMKVLVDAEIGLGTRVFLEGLVLKEWESSARKWAGDDQEIVKGLVREVGHLWRSTHRDSGNLADSGR